MYGLVNNAIQTMICENHGQDKWMAVKKKSGVTFDYFVSNEPYDDDITFRLAIAAGEILSISLNDILVGFGEYWILKTAKNKYDSLIQAGGSNLKEFLINLPAFHNRIYLIYPNLTPPEFKISNIEERNLQVHYYSQRSGLQMFVKGLLQGLGKLYGTPCKIEIVYSRDMGNDHEIFKVSW